MMRVRGFLLLLLVIGAVSKDAGAVDQCFYQTKSAPGIPQYDRTSSSFTLGDAGKICSPYAVKDGVINQTGTHNCSNGQTLPRYTWNCRGCCDMQSTVIVKGCPGAYVWDPVSNSCQPPPPPPCQSGVAGPAGLYSVSNPLGTACFGGCSHSLSSVCVKLAGDTDWSCGAGPSTGAQCTGGDTPASPVPADPANGCVVDDKGRTVCPSATPDCITVDGNEVCGTNGKECEVVNGFISCAGGVPTDADSVVCWQENGQTVCAGTGAEVTSSTTSVTDPVTGEVTKTTTTESNIKGAGTKTTVTVYDSGGNIISSKTTITGGKDPGGSGTGSGQGGELGQAGEDDDDTDEGGFGVGQGSDMPELTTTDEASLKATFAAEWAAVPIVAAVNQFGSLSLGGGGSCPSFDVPWFGSTINFDGHCTVWASQIAPVLSVVFLAIWCLVAVRVFLSA